MKSNNSCNVLQERNRNGCLSKFCNKNWNKLSKCQNLNKNLQFICNINYFRGNSEWEIVFERLQDFWGYTNHTMAGFSRTFSNLHQLKVPNFDHFCSVEVLLEKKRKEKLIRRSYIGEAEDIHRLNTDTLPGRRKRQE